MSRRRGLHVNRLWAAVIQCFAFVRKEIAEILRQPRLILLLVIGPFSLLLLFGAGYRNQDLSFRTMFVGPRDSFYESALTEYEEQLDRFVDSKGYTDDEASALDQLADRELDVVVVFPPDPLAAIRGGESAEIRVLHNEVDPIQTTAVAIAAQLAVQEVNASVLTTIVTSAQSALRPVDELVVELTARANELATSAEEGGADDVATSAEDISAIVADLQQIVADSERILERLGAEANASTADVLRRLAEVGADAHRLADGGADDIGAEAEAVAATIADLTANFPDVTALEPAVLVEPFASSTESVVPTAINDADYYAPSSLALLLQHLAVTFAALSVVRDRQLGLFELLRISPVSSFEIFAGKTIAYSLIGMAVGIGLLAAAVRFLGVPFVGEYYWAIVTLGLVLLAALALGLLISLLSRTETQAVQWSMLSLLAGLFFSGFILDVDGLSYPVKAISWALPVTYGIRLLQDVMLRGVDPDPFDLAGLGALVVVYGGLAVILLRRQLRTA